MRLVADWEFVLRRSHSMWGTYLTILFLALPEVIYAGAGIDTSPRIWWLLALAAALYTAIGRVVDQGDEDGTGPLIPLGSIAMMALVMFLTMGMGKVVDDTQPPPVAGPPNEADWAAVAVPLVAKWEGLRTTAYLDTIAEPDIWTVCYGETNDVQPGDSYTADECAEMLRKRLRTYRAGWHGYLTPQTLQYRLTAQRDGAYTSFAYNVGVVGAGGSTATRRLNAGNIRGGCEAIGWWNKAGGRVIRGLVNRRAEEIALCLVGL